MVSGTDWRSPIEFSGASISGSETLREFREYVAKTFLALPEVGPAWWIEKSIMQGGASLGTLGNIVDVEAIFCDRLGLLKLELPELTSDLVRVAARYGLEFDEGTSFIVARANQRPKIIDNVLPEVRQRALAIPLIPLPEERDPRIYRPDIGTHQSCSGSLERWKGLMEWEGRTDAETTLKYLAAYNDFIREPSVGALMRATENPRTGTDSYFLAMSYIGGVFQLGEQAGAQPGSPQRAVYDLLGLLHMSFYTSYSSVHSPASATLFPECDQRLLKALVTRFVESH